jgi:hypothetical protein
MKKILIFTGNQTYAPSKTSSTTLTGTNTENLASGAVGIYGLVEIDATTAANNNRFTLLTNGTSSAGLCHVDDFITGGGSLFRIVQGYTETPVQTGDIQCKGITRIIKQAYTAPVQGVAVIGYNGTSGSLNLPTIVQNDSATLLAVQQEVSTNDQIREQLQFNTATLAPSTAAYDILVQLANAINSVANIGGVRTHIAEILANGARTTIAIGGSITGSGTAAVQLGTATNGSKTVTITSGTLTATTIAAGSLITIGGVTYKVVGTPNIAANVMTITLDNPYEGVTTTATRLDGNGGASPVFATQAASTEFGLQLTTINPNSVFNYAKQGVIENATVTYTVNPSQGLGTGAEIVKIEEGLIAYRGQFDTFSKWMKQLPRFANADTNYNIYSILFRNTTTESGVEHNKGDNSAIQIAVPTTWTAVTTFEAVLKKLAPNAIINF